MTVYFITIFSENQFRGVSKDEVSFLDQVAKHAFEHEKKISEEVNKELQDYRISFITSIILLFSNISMIHLKSIRGDVRLINSMLCSIFSFNTKLH